MENLAQRDYVRETLPDWRSFKLKIVRKGKIVEIKFVAHAEYFHAGGKAQLDDGGKIFLGDKITSGRSC
jgi:hypothetical protein